MPKILKNQTEKSATVCLAIDPVPPWAMLFLVRRDDVSVEEHLFGLFRRHLVRFKMISIVLVPQEEISAPAAQVYHRYNVATLFTGGKD